MVMADFKGVETWKLELTTFGKIKELHAELDQGYGFAVSDGSFCDEKGTTAWIIEGEHKNNRVVGVWTTLGIAKDHISF